MGNGQLTEYRHLKRLGLYKGNMANIAQIKPIDHALLADDTCLEIPRIERVGDKLVLYNTIYARKSMLIQW